MKLLSSNGWMNVLRPRIGAVSSACQANRVRHEARASRPNARMPLTSSAPSRSQRRCTARPRPRGVRDTLSSIAGADRPDATPALGVYKLARGRERGRPVVRRAARRRGVWTISAGNAGQGVAYAARAAGRAVHRRCDRDGAASKLERMRALGAKLVLVPYAVAWQALEDRSIPGVEGHSSIHSTTTTSSPAMGRWAWRSWRMRPTPLPSLPRSAWRPDHGAWPVR